MVSSIAGAANRPALLNSNVDGEFETRAAVGALFNGSAAIP
jgi:hypothetical protein